MKDKCLNCPDYPYVTNENRKQICYRCDFHALTHEDTEILGMFCDFYGIHGEKLKRLFIRGYLKWISPRSEKNDNSRTD